MVKKLPANAGDIGAPWVGTIPWRKAWQPTLVFLPEESHGQRNLESYVHRVTESQIQLKQIGTHPHNARKCTKQDTAR